MWFWVFRKKEGMLLVLQRKVKCVGQIGREMKEDKNCSCFLKEFWVIELGKEKSSKIFVNRKS